MTISSAISDGAGGLIPSTWYKHYGMDYNGASYCFITDDDLVSPSSRELNAPHGRLIELVSTPVTLSKETFGIHFHRIYNNITTFPDLPIGFVRSHDGGLRWQEIQPSNSSSYDWGRFDTWLNHVESNNCTPVFTVFGTPSWASSRPAEASAYGINGLAAEPSNMNDLANFVTAVAQRYGSRIQYYEVWNEPNLIGFYTGTKAKLVDMVKTVSNSVKTVVPTAKIICPAITSFRETAGSSGEVYLDALLTQQDTALTGTMLNWIDIVGVHLYYNHVTVQLSPMITRIKNTLTSRGYGAFDVWDTESGILSPFPDTISNESHLQIMKRKILNIVLSGIKKQFWYSYDHTNMGFMNNAQVFDGYKSFIESLTDRTVVSAIQRFDGTINVIFQDGGNLII